MNQQTLNPPDMPNQQYPQMIYPPNQQSYYPPNQQYYQENPPQYYQENPQMYYQENPQPVYYEEKPKKKKKSSSSSSLKEIEIGVEIKHKKKKSSSSSSEDKKSKKDEQYFLCYTNDEFAMIVLFLFGFISYFTWFGAAYLGIASRKIFNIIVGICCGILAISFVVVIGYLIYYSKNSD